MTLRNPFMSARSNNAPCAGACNGSNPMCRCSALRHAGHVRQAMGDALVAVDAGLLARTQPQLVDLGGPRALAGQVHGIEVVAVAALQRVVGLRSEERRGGKEGRSQSARCFVMEA